MGIRTAATNQFVALFEWSSMTYRAKCWMNEGQWIHGARACVVYVGQVRIEAGRTPGLEERFLAE